MDDAMKIRLGVNAMFEERVRETNQKADREARVKSIAPIRAILNELWDPIGVTDDNEDEYDTYALAIWNAMQTGRPTAEELEAFLTEIETRAMGLRRVNPSKVRETVRALLVFYDENLRARE